MFFVFFNISSLCQEWKKEGERDSVREKKIKKWLSKDNDDSDGAKHYIEQWTVKYIRM